MTFSKVYVYLSVKKHVKNYFFHIWQNKTIIKNGECGVAVTTVLDNKYLEVEVAMSIDIPSSEAKAGIETHSSTAENELVCLIH